MNFLNPSDLHDVPQYSPTTEFTAELAAAKEQPIQTGRQLQTVAAGLATKRSAKPPEELPRELPRELPEDRRRRMSPMLNPLAWTPLSTGVIDGPSPEGELVTLLNRLDPLEISAPPNAVVNGVYSDLAIAEYRLRLYALVRSTVQAAESSLSLFLVLGPIQGSYLPIETRLSVQENNLLLTEANHKWISHPAYLYTQVFGTWEEKFTVEVLLPNARPLTMPPLSF